MKIFPGKQTVLSILCGAASVSMIAANALSAAPSDQDKNDTPSIRFSRMEADQVRSELLQWLAQASSDQELLSTVTAEWADDTKLFQMSGEQILDALVTAFAAVDPATQRLVDATYAAGPVDAVIFDGVRDLGIYRNQISLYQARWYVQHRFYDEAMALLQTLQPDNVVDPASLLFYRAVCESKLLQREDAIDSLTLLLNNTLDVPPRFQAVAEMMLQELKKQNEEGMEVVSRLMSDVQRRLDLGRSGEKVQGREAEVIDLIDKMLEDMENQQQQQSGGGGSSSGDSDNQARGSGADQSTIKGSTADGEADHKDVTEAGQWGLLDQQAQARARELIRQQFPSNFLDAIGRYTKKIAEQKK